MSNAEYAMLVVYVLMIKWILKVMHTGIICFCLLFAVSCVMFSPYLVVIPVLRHDLI